MMGRGDDNRNAFAQLIAATGGEELPAVHDRHHQIQDDRVRRRFAHDIQRDRAICGRVHRVALIGQSIGNRGPDDLVILDDKNPLRIGCRHGRRFFCTSSMEST